MGKVYIVNESSYSDDEAIAKVLAVMRCDPVPSVMDKQRYCFSTTLRFIDSLGVDIFSKRSKSGEDVFLVRNAS